MKTFYKWFNVTLIIFLIIIPTVTYIPLTYLTEKNIIDANFFNNIIGPIFNFLFIGSYFFGGLYIGFGFALLIGNILKKKINVFNSIQILITGIIMVVIPYVIFSFCGFFGMCAIAALAPSTPQVPIDPNNHYHGFPVQDLKIINIQPIQPNTPGDTWGCDITVQNTNSTITANNIAFGLAYSTFISKEDDTTLPGQTRVIRIASYDYGVKNPCATKATIQNAGIVKTN